jgi:hypothetical protein
MLFWQLCPTHVVDQVSFRKAFFLYISQPLKATTVLRTVLVQCMYRATFYHALFYLSSFLSLV